MLTCGSAVEALPTMNAGATTAPSSKMSGAMVLAVPRSAVIDTGKNKIVYVESSQGVYDMRAVKLGPLAGDDYPVFDGLAEGDRVVTIGTFLIDAENRLNPMRVADAPAAEAGHAGHQH
jgi:Cu(I)/Ag(I) efflux system membrane fusion protein